MVTRTIALFLFMVGLGFEAFGLYLKMARPFIFHPGGITLRAQIILTLPNNFCTFFSPYINAAIMDSI